MRVIAGQLGGRIFDSPHVTRTHPMSEKMCGALFAILGDIEDLTVLDAFAGSGALSFEACSRGALRATAIEIDRQSAKTIARNIEKLGLQKTVQLVQASNESWMRTNTEVRFDIVLCDPPYDNPQLETVGKLAKYVARGGILVLSYPSSEAIPELPDLGCIEQRSYGDARLIFYRG